MVRARKSLLTKVLLANVPALLLTVFVGIWAHHSMLHAVSVADNERRAQEAINSLSAFMKAAVDAETGVRGFVINGDPGFLAPYDAALVAMYEHSAKLRALLAAPQSVKQLARAEALFHRWQAEGASSAIVSRRTGLNQQAALHAAANHQGKALMDEIRQTVRGIMRAEREQLAKWRAERMVAVDRAVLLARTLPWSSLLLTAAINLVIAFRAARAIGGVSDAAEKFAAGDMAQRAPIQARDEIGALARAFNAMADRLSQRTAQSARFGEFSELLVASLSAEEVISLFNEHAPEIVGASWTVVGSLEQKGAHRASGSTNIASNLPALFGADDCWALRRGRLHAFGNGWGKARCPHLEGLDVPATVCVPLTAHGETIGTVVFGFEGEGGRALDEDTLKMAETVGERLALALSAIKLRESLREQSVRDPLTRLFNRRYLEESFLRELSRAKRQGTSVGLLLIDVDHFKKLNDSQGHEAGDVVLVELGSLLASSIRASDIACRYGGEEFVIVMPDVDSTMLVARAEMLRAAARRLHIVRAGKTIGPITVSIGAALYPEHGENISDVVRMADSALYRAKANGRDRTELAHLLEPRAESSTSH